MNNAPMKIVYVIPVLGYGGAETQLLLLAKNMLTRGHSVKIVQALSCSPKFLSQYTELGIEVISLGMKKSVSNPYFLIKLRRVFDKLKPDIIHSHIAQANVLARIANWRQYPLICTAHSSNEKGRLNVEKLYKYTDSLSHWNTNVSVAAVDRYIELGLFSSERSDYVPNGVDTDHFSRANKESNPAAFKKSFSDASKFTFLAIGRFVTAKNFPLMLRSIAKVDANLLVCGEGSLEADLKSLVTALEIEDRVAFVDTMTDVRPLYQSAGAFIMSSTWEGLPMVLLEAMAMSLPVISTNVSGAATLFADGLAGKLVFGFDVDDYAEALREMTMLPANELAKMGEHGRKKVVDEFSIKKISQIWIAKYQHIIESAKPTEHNDNQ
jgi:glycosyltransferase involved in cell wall biosynthesis